MTKLPQLRVKEIVMALKRLDFEHRRTTGSHIRLVHPDGRKVTVPMHKGDIPKGTLRSILRQAEISLDELLANL